MITLHTIVKNEARFVKSALLSVLLSNEVARALVWDTGSSDGTVKEILSIGDKRIEFSQKGRADRKGLVYLRKEQLKMTKTPWFMLVDGDEIWPEKNLRILVGEMEKAGKSIAALVNKTRNAAGDIYHYLPESEGHYRIGGRRGHLNIRAIRNLPGLTVKGIYPNEWYELGGVKIQEYPVCLKREASDGAGSLSNKRQEFCLKFVDAWYLHATHLKRSGNWLGEFTAMDRLKKHKWFYKLKRKKLLEMNPDEIPGIFER